MTPERLRQIEALYHSARERDAGSRITFLADACGTDEELRREIESLLAQESGDSPLARPAWEGVGSLSPSAAPLKAGTELGPYKIDAQIGAGGMGEVYRARDTRLNRDVAIKISAERFSSRFQREGLAVAALNHPNICTLHDVGPNYLVMELVEGPTLADRIKQGAIPLEEALGIAKQIAAALEDAHEKGIVHRDLKPANIKIKPDGTVKMLDFGLATTRREGDGATVTEPGTILGTAAYMSPEQARGKPVDKRADVWAFGAVVYEMVTGERAFRGETVPDVLAAMVNVEPDWSKAPEKVRRLLGRCLEKDPKKRLRDIGDMVLLLEADEGVRRGPGGPPHKRWWVAIAAATLLIGALGGWAVSHFRQPLADERSFRLKIDPPEGGRFAFGASSHGIALSPDGKTAAYVANTNGKNELWVRPLDGNAARLLPGTEGAAFPFWSPDSKSIAFFTVSKLERVELAGGSPLAICDVAEIGVGGSWSSNGQILFGSWLSGLFQVPASGGAPLALTTTDPARGEFRHHWPQVLPGGRFLYHVQSDKPGNTGVYAASFAKPAERVRLLTTDTNALYASGNDGKSYLLWLRGLTLFAQEFDAISLKLGGEPHPVADSVASSTISGEMFVTVSANGLLLYAGANPSSQFTWLDRTGKSLGVVGEPGEYPNFRLSPDGRRVAVTRVTGAIEVIWLLEVERGVFSRFTSNSGNLPVWSPDGRTILFYWNGQFRKDSSGAGGEQRIDQSPKAHFANDWSRDGRFVLYGEMNPHAPWDLWTLPVSTDGTSAPGTQPKPYLQTAFFEVYGRFSPEEHPRWVAYESNESGREEIYIQAFPEPHGATRISTGGGQFAQWSPDGRELFYVSPDNKLMAVNLTLGSEAVQPSAPRELFLLPAAATNYSPYEVAPDGQRFLVRATPQQAAKPLTVIVNWPALLKKAVAP